mmetsp:Transcript_20055/g.44637  ORF Transcript_20055/g.44637 Transcript_20055/m.44637 type:complete len:518 (+) Transcript_20055:41-1594(+)
MAAQRDLVSAGDNQVYGQALISVHADMATLSRESHKDSFAKCKIICTMGPKCWDVDNLVKLMDAGMNVARLNFSHGDHEAHGATVQRLREAMKQRPHHPLAILLDTKGPEIRSGFYAAGGSITLEAGQALKIVTDYDFKGDSTCIACTYDKLPTSVKPGNTILMADGSLSLEVTECGADYVMTKVMNSAVVGERKNMNLPGVHVDLPVLGDKDKSDLVAFGIPQGVDFVAASFVQSGQDVRDIRKILGPRGRRIKIISKIENEEGLKNYDEILAESDGIMVARGDLGMEIPTEKVFLAQKMMIAKANMEGKPVITATQMLESMIKNPRPTRAEASDVANAVLDGTDCVMLSGETANGDFPVQAAEAQHNICTEAECVMDYDSLFTTISTACHKARVFDTSEAVCSSAVKASLDMGAKLIVVLTETGHTARLVAKYRPRALIFACCASESTIAHLQIVRGVTAMQVPSFKGTESVLHSALEKAKERGFVKAGDHVVAVHGMKEEMPGASNLMKVVQVE